MRSVISPCTTRVRKVGERFMSIQTHYNCVCQLRGVSWYTAACVCKIHGEHRITYVTRYTCAHRHIRSITNVYVERWDSPQWCSTIYRDSPQRWTMNSCNTSENTRLTLSVCTYPARYVYRVRVYKVTRIISLRVRNTHWWGRARAARLLTYVINGART